MRVASALLCVLAMAAGKPVFRVSLDRQMVAEDESFIRYDGQAKGTLRDLKLMDRVLQK